MKQQSNDAAKALQACAAYAGATAEISSLKKIIIDNLEKCHGITGGRKMIIDANKLANMGFIDVPLVTQEQWENAHAEQTHMARAFRRIETDDGPGYLSDNEVLAEIGDCPHCVAAYEAVLARKAARKVLSAVKRRIGTLGRKINKVAVAVAVAVATAKDTACVQPDLNNQ